MKIKWSVLTDKDIDRLIKNAEIVRSHYYELYDKFYGKPNSKKNIFIKFIDTVFKKDRIPKPIEVIPEISLTERYISLLCVLKDFNHIKNVIQNYHDVQLRVEYETLLPYRKNVTGTKLTFYQNDAEDTYFDLHLVYKYKKCELYLPPTIDISDILTIDSTFFLVHKLNISVIDKIIWAQLKKLVKVTMRVSIDMREDLHLVEQAIKERTPEESNGENNILAKETQQ
ncbi:MAG: hypothetical protein J5525_12360 [Lachnospiraceae bacterium]|nr:hypothetical protein [Lachnospiraceae bacterium]